jgi:hypothetical protein
MYRFAKPAFVDRFMASAAMPENAGSIIGRKRQKQCSNLSFDNPSFIAGLVCVVPKWPQNRGPLDQPLLPRRMGLMALAPCRTMTGWLLSMKLG